VQRDHLHLIVEADDAQKLSSGARGLAIRATRALNARLRLRGRFWGDRYHGHALRTPREVRNALVYVLMNVKKHTLGWRGLDPCSSARWFDGFRGTHVPDARPPPTVPATTWLATAGWRRHGLISVTESPAVVTVASGPGHRHP
jgi:hypothetical protein